LENPIAVKRSILQKSRKLGLGPNLMCLIGSAIRTEHLQQFPVLPFLDIIVGFMHAMDKPLDCVSLVADHETMQVNPCVPAAHRGSRETTHMIGVRLFLMIVLSS
jgi:hypothetical protein